MGALFSNLNRQCSEPEEYVLRGFCTCCAQRAYFFRDRSSYREFVMTGLCQNCQDEKYNSFEPTTRL